ncbi:hypothetical protein J2125_004344 [Erwinia toletana]|uniref:Uncharacterized protein n=1 Tax=Winslowiella toletana TaxID=92490 RepID=A0ABS4PEV0_9GAMM|nr:hypothetical protein [Winslowiella toletana]
MHITLSFENVMDEMRLIYHAFHAYFSIWSVFGIITMLINQWFNSSCGFYLNYDLRHKPLTIDSVYFYSKINRAVSSVVPEHKESRDE